MDIKHVLSRNPLHPVYLAGPSRPLGTHPPKAGWFEHDGGPVEIGHRGEGFGFDNEFPVHTVHLTPFGLADRPVTCGEWLSFMEDDGYRRPEFWLSDGWAVVNAQRWDAPLYWWRDPDDPDRWLQFTLAGVAAGRPRRAGLPRELLRGGCIRPLDRHATAHRARVGDRRRGPRRRRQPLARRLPLDGAPHPRPAVSTNGIFGDTWEWTSSAYSPYPGFRAAPGAVGEYNGKFMVSQYVLRGGCCATPARARPRHLPQLLPARRPLVVRRRAPGPGSLSRGLHHRRAPLPRRGARARCGPTP